MVDVVQTVVLVVLAVLVVLVGAQSVKLSLQVQGMVATETARRQQRAARLAERLAADPTPSESPGRGLLRARLAQKRREREARG